MTAPAPAPAPARCGTCGGNGLGPLVIGNHGTYRASCGPCNGTGQTN